jgi:hypothetical protein
MGGGGPGGPDRRGVTPTRSELHFVVPTTRPRHYVTETPELAVALDAAAQRWPGLSRSQLLVRLALSAAEAERVAEKDRRDRRLAALERLSSEGIPGLEYPPDYLEKLREDWPE